MDDLTMTRLCAEAMGFDVFDDYRDCNPPVDGVAVRGEGDGVTRFHPLTNDAQAMELVKMFRPDINCSASHSSFRAGAGEPELFRVIIGEDADVTDTDLNRAIVLAVAQMQAEKARHG